MCMSRTATYGNRFSWSCTSGVALAVSWALWVFDPVRIHCPGSILVQGQPGTSPRRVRWNTACFMKQCKVRQADINRRANLAGVPHGRPADTRRALDRGSVGIQSAFGRPSAALYRRLPERGSAEQGLVPRRRGKPGHAKTDVWLTMLRRNRNLTHIPISHVCNAGRPQRHCVHSRVEGAICGLAALGAGNQCTPKPPTASWVRC